MPRGELVFANVLDVRQRAAESEMANGQVYLLSVPARALPFAVLRDWKAPTGYLSEEVHLIAPAGSEELHERTASVSELRMLEGRYHEPFNDLGSDEVFAGIAEWLRR